MTFEQEFCPHLHIIGTVKAAGQQPVSAPQPGQIRRIADALA
jgi:hypothetical protein